MVEWLKSLPKTAFVAIVLGGGILFIVLSDPPRTVCHSQLEKFNETTHNFLSLDPIKRPNKKETRFTKLIDTCKATNSAGGCYELFFSMKQMLKDAHAISPECKSKLAGHKGFETAVWQTLDLMTLLAWGAKPPASVALKAGWFDPADLNLFCDLKTSGTQIFGESRWNTFADGYFKTLPEAATLERNDAWQRMLLSVNCSNYL